MTGDPVVSRPDGIVKDSSSRLVSPAFIGRQAQLTELAGAFAAARRGEPATVLFGGEAGAGKSRLTTEFAGQARALGARVLIGSCLQLGAEGAPFTPFTDVMRDLTRADGAAAVTELLDGEAGEISRLLPELGAPGPTPAEPADPGAGAGPAAGRGRLFGQVLTLLGRLGGQGPVVLAVEDLHWASPSTRDLLEFLVSRQQALPGVLIIGTFRSDELHRTHPLRPLLAGLTRQAWVQRAELPPLTRHETAGLLAAILGCEPEPARVDSVFSRSGGNPLYAEELLGCGDVRPPSLRQLLLARAQRLPTATQEVLRIAGAAGESAGPALLGAVSGLGDDDLARVLRPAVAGNLLVAGAGGYAFRHALIREAMYEDLLPGERSTVHAQFAAAIAADESRAGGQATCQLAHHWYAAHDLSHALASAWRAAAEAARVFGYAEQLAMLARVSELWDTVPGAAELIGTSHDQLLEQAARVAQLLGQDKRARALISAALREIDPAAEPGRVAALLDMRSRLSPAPRQRRA
ncbi:MAG TPA: AAA family ATPase [Streptosporangiaceae bacterium]